MFDHGISRYDLRIKFLEKIYRIMWIYWNAFEVSNVSLFLYLSANYNIFFWHDLWNDAWIGWMIFCYENILFEMLWWSMIEHIDFMMQYWLISILHDYMFYYQKLEYEIWFMKNYDIRNIMNWQPDYVKDPANGGIYVGNWLSWGFISPTRPATCRQRDQRQTASETSGSKGHGCQMIRSLPQADTWYYDPVTEKMWS